VRAWLGERELALGAPRQRAVLAVLAMRAGQLVTRDQFIDAVWGDKPRPPLSRSINSACN
jgi:DNA-binding winged helix-turn-helix (wHTH) protein